GDRRWQQDANHLLSAPNRAKPACQKNCARERAAESHLWSASIRHGEAKRMPPRRLHKRAMQRSHVTFSQFVSVCAQFLHSLPNFLRGSGGRHRLSICHCDRIGKPARQLPQKSSSFKAEERAPYSAKVHWNDRNFYAFYDSLHAAAKGKHLADAGHLAFGKDA